MQNGRPLWAIAGAVTLTAASCAGPTAGDTSREASLRSIVRPTEARSRRDETAQSLSGSVVDDTGAPLAGVLVSIEGPVPLRSGEPNPVVRSDEQGRFDFGVLPWASYLVSAACAGHATARLRVVLAASDASIAFQLRAAQELAGRVVDADGSAVAGATVRFVRPSDPWSAKRAKTDASGTFLITDVDDRPGTVEVDRYGVPDEWSERRVLRERDVIAGGPAREFRFRRGLPIGGVVVDEKGRPARNVAVQALAPPASDDAECWGARTTGEDGSFEIRDLPPGRYALRLWRWWSTSRGPARELVGGDDVEPGRTDVRLVLTIQSHQ